MKFNTTILPSGLRVITVPMADNPSVTVLIMVEAGSKYETKQENGLSHFLEHMVFKGTTRRPKASDISRELDSIGAHYNAFTSQEYTGYYAKADARHFDTVLDVVSDMYLDPLFDENEIRKEKGVIIEEIRMYKDLPQHRVHNLISEVLHGDQPAGWTVSGSEDNVRSFTKGMLADYRARQYVNDATTVIVSGSFDEKESLAAIEKAFSGISKDVKRDKKPVIEAQKGIQIKTEFKETDQTHMVIAVRTFPVKDQRTPALQILATILSGGMSSRLFAKMRDELGICYYINASPNPNTDHGDLSVSAGLDNSRVEEGIKGILGELRRLKDEPVPEAELKKAKDYMAGTTLLELETSDARAEFSGLQQALKGKVEPPEEIIAKVQKVTAEDIQKLARQIFVNDRLNMALVGRFKDNGAFKPYFTLE